uniref:NB-ARC domain-containing protein n=1 Tax=Oryza glumipatula TaxID=40148 RepID=A0A0E0BLF6_9ORYZ
MTQLVTFVLDFSRTDIPVEMIKMLANMPDAVEILLRRFDVLDKLPGSTLFPQCLRQLDLFANVIKEDPMPIVEKLPCLVVLSLSGYQGRTMSCSAQGFPRLQRLDLSMFYTEEWIIETGALPRLSHLGLHWFRNMRKLPDGLVQLPSLKELVLKDPLISEDDITCKDLRGKGCKVTYTKYMLSGGFF